MLYYKRSGLATGETIVMLHGFLGSRTIFDKVLEELEAHYDILRIDLPGHGNSELTLQEASLASYVDAITDVLTQEKIEQATWLGHSMGGYITLAAIAAGRLTIDKAILAYSSASPDSAETKEKREQQRQQIQEQGVSSYVDNSIRAFFAEDAREEDIDFARKIGYEASSKGLQTALSAMKNRPDQQALLDQTSIPILVLEGAFDKAVTPIQTNNIAVQKIVTQTGHLGMLEDPAAFVKAVRQFLG